MGEGTRGRGEVEFFLGFKSKALKFQNQDPGLFIFKGCFDGFVFDNNPHFIAVS